MNQKTCVFCRILRREVPAKLVYENDQVLAFEDVNPVAPVHVLIIPKEHIGSINEISPLHDGLMGQMVTVAKEIARKQNIHETGFRLVINNGVDVGQSVFHLHMHVMGGRAMAWPPG